MQTAHKYLVDQLSYAFQWQDDGRELCWCDGTTIAFVEEVSAVLERLAVSKLPPFSVVAMAMATLRGSWPDIANRMTNAVSLLLESRDRFVVQRVDERREVLNAWPNARECLSILTNYAVNHEPSSTQRGELLAIVLRDIAAVDGAENMDVTAVVAVVRGGMPVDWLHGQQRLPIVAAKFLPMEPTEEIVLGLELEIPVVRIIELIQLAQQVANGVPWTRVAEIEHFLATGIPDLPHAPESVLPEPVLPDPVLPNHREQTRALLKSLEDDRELAGFARLTKHLMAAVTLPRTISAPDDMPMGGVSDITNRGELDRLLISELAHDDETLAVRLALNEALYLRREVPPADHRGTRRVFIDLSLPMWGLPRLYGTAMALALHATTERHVDIRCLRADRGGLVESVLNTASGLREHLAALEPTEHPGARLADFFADDAGDPDAAEPVLITTTDVLECPEFRRDLERSAPKCVWIIAVERDGALQLLQRTRQGLSVRRQVRLSLSDILSPRSQALVHDPSQDSDAPAIFALKQFPLLLPHSLISGLAWRWNDGVISLTNDRRLMHWKRAGEAATQLLTGLPRVAAKWVFLFQRDADNFGLLIVRGKNGPSVVVRINERQSLATTEDLRTGVTNVTDVVPTHEALLVFGQTAEGLPCCSAIDISPARLLGSHMLARNFKQRVGRCIQLNDGSWNVLTWQGGHPNWVLQRLPQVMQSAKSVCEIGDGQYAGISQRGELFDLDGGRFGLQMRGWFANAKHTPQTFLPMTVGRAEIVVMADHQFTATTSFYAVPLDGQAPVWTSSGLYREASQVRAIVKPHSLHYRFVKLGFESDGLLLYANNRTPSRIEYDGRNGVIRMRQQKQPSQLGSAANFAPALGMDELGFVVQRANWPNGNTAWLDYRGLLHLRTAGGASPEITLILRDGTLAGWLSSGEVFGEPYYIGHNSEAAGLKTISPLEAWQKAVRPFIESLPWNLKSESGSTQIATLIQQLHLSSDHRPQSG